MAPNDPPDPMGWWAARRRSFNGSTNLVIPGIVLPALVTLTTLQGCANCEDRPLATPSRAPNGEVSHIPQQLKRPFIALPRSADGAVMVAGDGGAEQTPRE